MTLGGFIREQEELLNPVTSAEHLGKAMIHTSVARRGQTQHPRTNRPPNTEHDNLTELRADIYSAEGFDTETLGRQVPT